MKHSVREVTLKNGAKGLLIHVPGATVMSFDINFRAGEFLCEPDKYEAAHLMEHLVLGANKKYRSSQKFSRILEQNGAYSNASTSAYNINYEAECADFEWDRILDLLLLAIGQPLFLQKEFDAEYGNVVEELTQRSNNYVAVLARAVRKEIGFEGHTYQEGIDSMPNISVDDVKRFHDRTHYSSNMRFIIAGNVHARTNQIIRKLEAMDIPNDTSGRIELPEEKGKAKKDNLYLDYGSVPNVFFTIETMSDGLMSEPEIDAGNAANSILNGGYASKIFGKAREQGIVYDLGSSLYYSQSTTAWGIDGQVSRSNAGKLFELIARELQKIMHDGVTLADLQHVKKQAIGHYYRSGQTVSGVANGYAGRYFWDDHVVAYDAYPDRVNAVTRARVQDVMQKLFAEYNWIVGFLGTATETERDALRSTIATIWR